MTVQTPALPVQKKVQPANVVVCATCHVAVSVHEVFDAWELGLNRDMCPRCQGFLLDVIAL